MSLLSCRNVSFSYAMREIIRNANFEINKGDRIGLIGSNGCGKTTLFGLISGALEPAAGEIITASGLTVGVVEQHACSGSHLDVFGELLTVFSHLSEMEIRIDELNRRIALSGGENAAEIEEFSLLSDEYRDKGGLTYVAMAHSCLRGLGFSEVDEKLPVMSLSGGQRTKLALGKLLLSEPELMLLDEPTNHLDTDSVEWLEDFLGKTKSTYAVISHDRYFLDRVTNRTMEISAHRVYTGKGSYSVFVKNRELRLETERREYEKAQLEIERIEKMIEQQKRFNQERNYITIASKEKQIERIKADMPDPPKKERDFKLRFFEPVRSGDEVLIAEGLSKSYGDKTLFSDVSFKLFRGEKLFLIGPNGCGKTTLLSVIMNPASRDAGLARFGHNVRVGFYEQTQRGFMTENTVVGEIYDRFPTLTIPEIRKYLGGFNFRDDTIEKRMCDLSGGERARVAILTLLLQKPNLLILDEPTNHLDFASREVLEEALAAFEGTVLCVSHDRYFINRVATKIMYFSGEKLGVCSGGYDDYLAVKRGQTVREPEKTVKKPNEYKLRKEAEANERKRKSRIAKIEDELASLEAELAEHNETLSLPETAADYQQVLELTALIDGITAKIDALETEWMELNESE